VQSPELWRARGQCGGPLLSDAGAWQGEIDAETCIGPDAGHLGPFRACPIAQLRQWRPLVDHVLQAYTVTRRFSVAPSAADLPLILAFDGEFRKIEMLEQADERRLAELQRKAARRG